MTILIGADPEIFVANDKGKIVSAHGLVPGTKADPHKVPHGAVQVDGMALEFNIDPAATEEEFVHNIQSVMNTLISMVPELQPRIVPTAKFTKAYLGRQPKEAVELGCDPDFNCYTGEENPMPDATALYRTASGHIHVGWTEDMDISDPGHMEACKMLAQQLDWFLAVPSLMFDKDKKRRELYGLPGAFRPKPYGMEYRVLSNAWLTDAKLISWVYQNTKLAYDRLAGGEQIGKVEKKDVINFFTEFKLTDEVVTAYAEYYNIPLPPHV